MTETRLLLLRNQELWLLSCVLNLLVQRYILSVFLRLLLFQEFIHHWPQHFSTFHSLLHNYLLKSWWLLCWRTEFNELIRLASHIQFRGQNRLNLRLHYCVAVGLKCTESDFSQQLDLGVIIFSLVPIIWNLNLRHSEPPLYDFHQPEKSIHLK